VHQGGFVMFTPMVQSSLEKKKNTKNLTKVFYRKNGESCHILREKKKLKLLD
jgi:hypothetical protein